MCCMKRKVGWLVWRENEKETKFDWWWLKRAFQIPRENSLDAFQIQNPFHSPPHHSPLTTPSYLSTHSKFLFFTHNKFTLINQLLAKGYFWNFIYISDPTPSFKTPYIYHHIVHCIPKLKRKEKTNHFIEKKGAQNGF